MSVSGFGLSVDPYLGLVLLVSVHSLYRRDFLMPVEPAELRPPPWEGCRSLPSGLGMKSVRSIWSWLSGFHARSPLLLLVLAPSGFPSLRHFLLLSLSLQSCAWFIFPLCPVLLGQRCWSSSACRLHCTDHPNASRIALGNCWVQ